MAGEKCSLTCNVKDADGKVKVSELWTALSDFFKKDRKEAVMHYFLTKDNKFLMDNSDVLEFDADGEVTIASLKKALERNGEYSKLSNNKTLEYLNNELHAGEYEYSEALDNILKFNKQNQFNQDYLATLKKKKNGRYQIEVVPRTAQAEYELADHVRNKILTEGIKQILEERGLSVEFLNNPSYAMRYQSDGLMAVAQVLDGQNTSLEVAEAAGHFVVGAMMDNPMMQRLIALLTPEVQTAIFKDEKSDLLRDDFIVSEESAREAAGILLGRALLKPILDADKSKLSKFGAAIPKSVKWILQKLKNLVGRIFGTYKPDKVQKMVDKAQKAAETAAYGFITNPEDADVQAALGEGETFVGGNVSKRLSNEVRRNVRAYYDTLGILKNTISKLRTSIGRAESPTNKDIMKKLKFITNKLETEISPNLSLEAFAEHKSLEGMVTALIAITDVLDNDVRSLLDEIQPDDRASAYKDPTKNAGNMRTVNSIIRNVAQLHQALSSKLDTLSSSATVQLQDADSNQLVTTVREAVQQLGDVLIGNEETYLNSKGVEEHVNGIAKVLEAKRRQLFTDAMCNFYGRETFERNAGKVWEQKGLKFKLVKSENRTVEVADLIVELDEDISWFDRYLGAAADCGDFVTACGRKVTGVANRNADLITSRFWDRLEELRLQMEDAFRTTDATMFYEVIEDEEGNRTKTGNLVSELHYGKWEADRHKYALQLKQEFNEYITQMKKQAYENNKNNPGFVFRLTDQDRAVFYHDFVAPKWEKWHSEHSQLDKSSGGKRMIPSAEKYHNSQWDELFDTSAPGLSQEEIAAREKRLKWYNAFTDLKGEMDAMLPKNATVRWRAPQMTGRFGHRVRNIKAQTGSNRAAFGNALRKEAADFMVIRPDEAWMFGSNNEFNEIEEDPLENPMAFEREKTNRLPLFGINKLKNMEDLSTDLFGSMLRYASMAATYKCMEQVVDIFELGRDVLKDRKVEGTVEKTGEESRAYSRYIKFLEKNVYGLGVTPPKWDRNNMWRKMANNLSSIGGRILLWGNLHGGIVNTGTGIMEILKEAAAGENFSMSELSEANKMYFDGILQTIGLSLADVQRPDDKNSLWIRHWNILSENKSFFRNQQYDNKMNLLDNRLWDWFGHTMMLPYSSGDHYMQTIPYYAMGIRTKVYDHTGNEMRLIDAYDIVDGEEVFAVDDKEKNGPSLGRVHKKIQLREGIYKSAGDIIKHDTVVDMLKRIGRFYANNPNAKGNYTIGLDFFSDEERTFLENEDFRVPTNVKQLQDLEEALKIKERELTFNEDDEAAFMDKCRNICNRLHGIYNTEDKVAFQQNFYGNLVMAMRGYALGMVNRRYAGSRFNVAQQKVVEGNYNTMFKVLMSAFYDIDNLDNWKAVGDAFLLTGIPFSPFMFSKKFGDRMKADMVKAGFSEHQYYNMRRTGADFMVIQAISLMLMLSAPGRHAGLLGSDDEDKVDSNDTSDNLYAGILYYFMKRWDREQEAFNTFRGMKNEATSLLDYMPVGLSGARGIWEIADLFVKTKIDQMGEPDLKNSELYYQTSKEGKYQKEDEKWKVKFLRLCPYIRSFYVFSHPYDAAAGYEYGRRVRGK